MAYLLYLSTNNPLEEYQSAYKPKHSTETTLLAVQIRSYINLDKGLGVFLTLLDLSASFDAVDHAILLDFMKNQLGVSGVALQWFGSYLSERTQHVIIDTVSAELKSLLYGAPQGSVLGPIIFLCSYTPPW